jgi:hypothetical protein
MCDSASLPLLNVQCGAILDSHPFVLLKGYGRGRAYAAENAVVPSAGPLIAAVSCSSATVTSCPKPRSISLDVV